MTLSECVGIVVIMFFSFLAWGLIRAATMSSGPSGESQGGATEAATWTHEFRAETTGHRNGRASRVEIRHR